jgi:general secretion pathway protein G
MKRTAFTMLELVFVIVIIGILAAIAVPRLAATRDDAQMTKGRSDVAAIRSGIVSERQARLLRGESSYISALDQGVAAGAENVVIFDNNGTPTSTILMYGITTKNANGHWMKTDDTTYTYQVLGEPVTFTYTKDTGMFDCDHADPKCRLLTE